MKKVWTKNYRPFVMGGSVNYPISTFVQPIEVRKIKGIEFFTFKTPSGAMKLAEGVTGGIIAEDFEDLLTAIEGCDKSFLKGQIDDAIRDFKPHESQQMTNDEFYSHYTY